MKVFRDFKLTGEPETLKQVIEEIDKILDSGWYRDTHAETELNSRKLYDLIMYCFSCSETDARRASRLWFGDHRYGELPVSNIIPKAVPELSYDEYNHILEEFIDHFVKPAIRDMEVEFHITDPEFHLEEWVGGGEAADCLRKFSQMANKSTGASHFLDRERWYDFVIAAHKNNAQLDSSMLKRWLKEEGGWPEDIAFELADQYESARSLLKYYDRHQ